MEEKRIASPVSLLKVTYDIYEKWDCPKHVWFRGEPARTRTPLRPKLYRGRFIDENYVLQEFRRKAPAFIKSNLPGTQETDKWLFLAQHYGLPTRLLDWTDSFFTAVNFAFEFEYPAIYMLEPIALNRMNATQNDDYAFPLTWYGEDNIGTTNIRAAWELNRTGTGIPVAIKPSFSDIRQALQSSCFTIFGGAGNDLTNVDGFGRLARIRLPSRKTKSYDKIYRFLQRIGLKRIAQFGSLDSLTRDIAEEFSSFGA